MTDVHSPEVRSRNMRSIRSANTKPEIFVRKALHAAGLRYRLGGGGLPGRPDIVLPRYRTAIFVHGCFWHGHDCKYFKLPHTRRDFWQNKIGANQQRDQTVSGLLLELGWSVIVIWECATRPGGMTPGAIAEKVRSLLGDNLRQPGHHELQITP